MREFIVPLAAATVSGITTLVFLNPPAAGGVNIEILRASVGFSTNATSAQQRVQQVSQVSGYPTLAATTPQKLKRQDAVPALVSSTNGAPGTAGTNATAEGAGAKTVISDDVFNVLNGILLVPTPAETLVFQAGNNAGYGLYFPAAPGTLTGWSAGVTFREV